MKVVGTWLPRGRDTYSGDPHDAACGRFLRAPDVLLPLVRLAHFVDAGWRQLGVDVGMVGYGSEAQVVAEVAMEVVAEVPTQNWLEILAKVVVQPMREIVAEVRAKIFTEIHPKSVAKILA